MAHKGLGVAYMLMSMKNQSDEQLQALAVEQWIFQLMTLRQDTWPMK
ncbi:MAG: hypothetical protein ACYSN9_00420 [Planctomycetota bacterium]|jgi:hypothetical protein